MGFVSTTPSIQIWPAKIYPSYSSPNDANKLPSINFHPSLTPIVKPIIIHKFFLHKTYASMDYQSPALPNKGLMSTSTTHQKISFLSTRNVNDQEKESSSSSSSSSIIPFSSKSRGSGEEDGRALETVLKLYTAIKQRNIRELSDMLGEECRCVCNFISCFKPFYGKKQVLEFFNFLLRNMGKKLEFVVEPTLQDGLNVGVHWRLEWDKAHVPLGKGSSFYILHVYEGKMLIKNIEMFMEPLIHIEPLRLKLMGYVMPVLVKLGVNNIQRRTVILFLLTLVFIVAFLLMFNLS